MSEKTAPAMFEGARVPKDPAPTTAAKPTDRAAALKSPSGGVPDGRLTGFALLPVVAVGLIALAAWSPMAALIAGGALLVAVLIGMVSRSAGKRRMATRTSVRPDGTVTTTTKPVSRREQNRRQRTRNGPSWRRPRGAGGSPNSRSRSWIPGSDRRNSQRSAAHNGPGSPGGRKTPGGRPYGSTPGRPSASQRMRDRLRPNRKDRNTAGSPAGPGGRTAPSGPGRPHAPGSPNSRSRDNSKRWPWSRNRNDSGSPNGRRPKNNAGSPGSPGGGSWRPWRGKSNGGGGPSGQPGGKNPRNVKHTAPSAPSGGKPSKVPNWVKRVVAPASPPPQREWTGGAVRRTKDKVRGKVRDKWRGAWSDNTPVGRSSRSSAGGASANDGSSEPERRNRWFARRRDGSSSTRSSATAAEPGGRYQRLRQKLTSRSKAAPVDIAARLDEVWAARGLGTVDDYWR